MKPILDGLNQTLKQPVLSETVCLTLLPTGKMPLEMPPIHSKQQKPQHYSVKSRQFIGPLVYIFRGALSYKNEYEIEKDQIGII